MLQENIQPNPMDVAGAIPGGDPVKTLDDGVAQVMEIIKAVGSVDTQINTPLGDMARGQFLITPTWDLPLHRWDLAKGTGQDTTMDAMLTQVCFDALTPRADGMRKMEYGGGHIFGPRVSVLDNSSFQDQLLGVERGRASAVVTTRGFVPRIVTEKKREPGGLPFPRFVEPN